jgi:hypothetical protein
MIQAEGVEIPFSQTMLNRFCKALGELCAAELLSEKWFLVPSLRVGFQWLDAVTRSGQPVIQIRLAVHASGGTPADPDDFLGCTRTHPSSGWFDIRFTTYGGPDIYLYSFFCDQDDSGNVSNAEVCMRIDGQDSWSGYKKSIWSRTY